MRKLTRIERVEVESMLADPPMGYMDDPSFHEPDAELALFDEAVALPEPNVQWYQPSLDRVGDAAPLVPEENRLLSSKQERAIFLQFNYARFRAAELQREYEGKGIPDDEAQQLLHWWRLAAHLRDRIVEFNLGLVLAMVRHVGAAKMDSAELVSEGNMALLRSVDKFDVSRNFKFSTYACRSILKAFSRLSLKHARRRALFPVSFDPAMETPGPEPEDDPIAAAEIASALRRVLENNEAHLSQREREVIDLRFPLNSDAKGTPMTLKEVGKLIGYSKERIRQIQRTALEKIRAALGAAAPGQVA